MPTKPKKPYPTFPLTPHATGWVKKINRKVVWIAGHVSPDEAEREWDRKKDALRGGCEVPQPTKPERQSVRDLSNRWLAVKLADAEAGKLTWAHYVGCRRAVQSLLRSVGERTLVVDLTPDHFTRFEQAARTIGGEYVVRRTCRLVIALFNHAAEDDWIDRPIKFGRAFRKLAAERPKQRRRVLPTAEQIRVILHALDKRITKLQRTKERDPAPAIQLRAMILMGLNGGYGQTDLAELPRCVVDLDHAIIDYRRGKTGVDRIVPLWPETVRALREVMEQRSGDSLVFRTREGQPYVRVIPKLESGIVISATTIDSVNQAYSKLLKPLNLKTPGGGFYTLRHLHRTVSDESGDQHAAWKIVGHKLPAMAEVYVQVTPERLRRVTDFVRQRLIVGRSNRARGSAACERAA